VSAVSVQQQVPRNALVWIVIAQFALVAPHWQRIPLWVLAVYVGAALWRMMVYQGRWSFPSGWVKALLTIACFGGIYLSYGTLLGLEPTVALLLAAFALKLIELAKRKDAYLLLFLGYFVCITEFLFSQDLPVVIYTCIPILLVTTALLALHQVGEHQFNRSSIRHAGSMLLQALPLMIVLFFLFPRIGPLWSVPLKSHAAKTGVSDFMRPGDISQLSQSDEVAFRVRFDGNIPSRQELYWRGLVMSRLDDGTWRTLSWGDTPFSGRRPPAPDTSGRSSSYSIILEPTQQRWLYALRRAVPQERKVLSTGDYQLYSPVEIQDEYQYRVTSWLDAPLDASLSMWRRRIEVELPTGDNPRTLRLARRMRAGVNSDADYVQAVLSMFNQQDFVYTLQPPLLEGDDLMDEFLFDTRRGFCEHYAYAFTVMMRAADVPARVVAGYQGGEVNPVNRTVIVHQFDAHAWAEVWLEGEGWRRVDPTAAVSPDRIEWGLEQAMQTEGSFLSGSPLSPLRFRNILWFNQIRLRYDALVYTWQRFVLGYDRDNQYDFLNQLLGEVSTTRFLQLLGFSWLVVMLPLAWRLLRPRERRPRSAADGHYLKFCRKLGRIELRRLAGEGPRRFAERVAPRLPSQAGRIWRITNLYEQLSYAAKSEDRQAALAALAEEVKALRVTPGR
jgi:transglutaminase-like putative cysteine protease